MKYRNGDEAKVRDQVVGRLVSGVYVAGAVTELSPDGKSVLISPAICGAVLVDAGSVLPIPASAFVEEKPAAEGEEKVVSLPPAAPPVSNENVAPGAEQFSTQPPVAAPMVPTETKAE